MKWHATRVIARLGPLWADVGHHADEGPSALTNLILVFLKFDPVSCDTRCGLLLTFLYLGFAGGSPWSLDAMWRKKP